MEVVLVAAAAAAVSMEAVVAATFMAELKEPLEG
jgi:hypothetical protein